MLWIAFAVVFLVALFLLKTTTIFKNKTGESSELAYNNTTIGALVNKDTDGDGIPDWEEKLWGTDPLKKETIPGTPDSVAIEKLKPQTEQNEQGLPSLKDENLTQTDKFSRELFATIAAATQGGQTMDQATVDQIGSSLAAQIQNSPPRKVFLLSDIKIINDDSIEAIKNYNHAVGIVYKGYKRTDKVTNILKKFIADKNNPDVSVLSQLDPIIEQASKIIAGMIKINVPQGLAQLHLDAINAIERIVENLSDIKLYNSDPVVAMGAMSKYSDNVTTLKSVKLKLQEAIWQGLKS